MRRLLTIPAWLVLFSVVASAYTLVGYKWAGAPANITYWVNATNRDGVSSAAVLAAVQGAANVWPNTGAGLTMTYGGTSTATSTYTSANPNGKNEIFFSTASAGSQVADTHMMWSAGKMIEFDITLFDGGIKFFGGSTGCASGIYIQDVMAHEFGHGLGLNHSSVSTATMKATASWCSTAWRTLDPDDAAGIKFLYPVIGPQPPPCAPTITPSAATVATGASTGNTITVTAASGCAWTGVSNAAWITVTAGASGSGNGTVTYSVAANSGAQRTGTLTIAGRTFTVTQTATTCAPGISPASASVASTTSTGTITVSAASGCGWTAASNASWLTITSGATGTANGSVGYSVAANTGAARTGTLTVAGNTFNVSQAAPAPSGGITITVTTKVGDSWQYVYVQWTGATGASIEIYQDNVLVNTTTNDGIHTKAYTKGSHATYVYKVCEVGGVTCSPNASITF
jgi:hypothetical protein